LFRFLLGFVSISWLELLFVQGVGAPLKCNDLSTISQQIFQLWAPVRVAVKQILLKDHNVLNGYSGLTSMDIPVGKQ